MNIKEQQEQTGCLVLGAVLNEIEFEGYMTHKYYYKSHYSDYYIRLQEAEENGW